MKFAMHRVLVTLMLLSGAGVALGTRVSAQEGTPAAVPPILQAYEDAWSSGDAAKVGALYTETAVREDVPTLTKAEGRAAIEQFAAGLFEVNRDARLDVTDGFVGESWAVAEWTYSGANATTGRTVTFRGASVIELEGGLISRESDYYDLPEMQQQIMAAATPAP
ncbi:MAG: nuclear transport factor 2 family protein [Thermomicrobiales bacterium]